MSNIVTGFLFIKKMEINELIDLSFIIVRDAVDSGIGICLGANVDIYNPHVGTIPFRLSDDPLDNNCEYLFSGDEVSVICCGCKEPRTEPLNIRLMRIQTFLQKLFTTQKVLQIILDINFEEKIDEEYKIITVDDFSQTLLDVYQQNNNTPPTMRLYIDRGYMPKEAEMKK